MPRPERLCQVLIGIQLPAGSYLSSYAAHIGTDSTSVPLPLEVMVKVLVMQLAMCPL